MAARHSDFLSVWTVVRVALETQAYQVEAEVRVSLELKAEWREFLLDGVVALVERLVALLVDGLAVGTQRLLGDLLRDVLHQVAVQARVPGAGAVPEDVLQDEHLQAEGDLAQQPRRRVHQHLHVLRRVGDVRGLVTFRRDCCLCRYLGAFVRLVLTLS